MIINIILVAFTMVGVVILTFFLICVYKQHRSSLNSEYIELFPKEDIYIENAYEGDRFNMSVSEKEYSERWAATQRGSVRIACGVYFTPDEYSKYREGILKIKLP
jgi:hypothetical protein